MREIGTAVVLAVVLAGGLPPPAPEAMFAARSAEQGVLLPTGTKPDGHPLPAVLPPAVLAGFSAYQTAGVNGVFAWVFETGESSTFELRVLGGLTGIETFDLFFVTSAGALPPDGEIPLEPCGRFTGIDERQQGSVCGSHGAVLMGIGLQGTFLYAAT